MYFTVRMPNPIDARLRARAIRAYEAGHGTHDDLADTFGVGIRTLQRWVARWRASGERTARPKGGGWRSPILMPTLEAVLAEAPDATCAELCWAYNQRVPREHQTTPTSLWRALRRARYVIKKNGRGRVRSIGRTSGESGRHS